MKRKLARFLTATIILLILLFTGGALLVWQLIHVPYKGYAPSKMAITIPPGTSVHRIALTLHEKGVLRHPWLLKGLFKVYKTEGQSKAGDYVFDRPMSPLEVYEKLMKGEMQYTLLRVIEGANVYDIEKIFVEKGIGTSAEFRSFLQSKSIQTALHKIDSSISSPEGFLFPETYFLTKREQTVEGTLLLMIRQFEKRFGEPEERRAKELGMTVLQIVTLASLIEKETGQSQERPLISGVFHARLKLGMLLQCDPTVIYALMRSGTYDGQLSRADLSFESPYNTYTSGGLPPGPICNPGMASLQAALYPVETKMLYFVSKNDGSHYFSATLQEHNRAVQQYQRNGRRSQ